MPARHLLQVLPAAVQQAPDGGSSRTRQAAALPPACRHTTILELRPAAAEQAASSSGDGTQKAAALPLRLRPQDLPVVHGRFEAAQRLLQLHPLFSGGLHERTLWRTVRLSEKMRNSPDVREAFLIDC